MLTLILAAVVAVALFTGTFLAFDVISGLVIGLLGGVGVGVLLLRRTRKPIEAAMKEVEAHMKNQRFEKAIATLEAMKPTARWQPGLASSLDAQIGMVRYAHMREFEAARPHLEKAHAKVWQAWAMLGAAHFKKERWDQMRAVFEKAVKRNKKEAMLWLTYGYCEWRRGAEGSRPGGADPRPEGMPQRRAPEEPAGRPPERQEGEDARPRPGVAGPAPGTHHPAPASRPARGSCPPPSASASGIAGGNRGASAPTTSVRALLAGNRGASARLPPSGPCLQAYARSYSQAPRTLPRSRSAHAAAIPGSPTR